MMITKQLIQYFESTNETRENFDLKALGDNQPVIYGSVGSETRHLVQSRWDLIKLKVHVKYLKYVLSFPGLIPSKTATKEAGLFD